MSCCAAAGIDSTSRMVGNAGGKDVWMGLLTDIKRSDGCAPVIRLVQCVCVKSCSNMKYSVPKIVSFLCFRATYQRGEQELCKNTAPT